METTGEYVVDIETNGFLGEGDRIHCIVAIHTENRTVHRYSPSQIEEGLEFLSKASKLVAHNGINFDYPFIYQCYPEANLPPLLDTLVYSRLIFSDLRDDDFRMYEKNPDYALPKKNIGSHALKSWGYRLGNNKGEFGEDTDWSTYSEEMLDYCEQDCWVTLDLLNLLRSKECSQESLELEHKFATIIQRQQEYGWAFDEKAASTLCAELVGKRYAIQEKMLEIFPGWWVDMKTPKYWEAGKYKARTKGELLSKIKKEVTDREERADLIDSIGMGEMKQKHTPFNPGSRHHIHRVFSEKYGWQPKEFTAKGEPKVDDTILQSLEYPEAKLLAEYFLLNKRIGQLSEGNQAWLRVVKGGRIHGSVNTLGAVTGRCTHSHPNVAQVPACGVPYGKECRQLFKASAGRVVVGADASGLELRCLAHYMAHWDKGEYARILLEDDIHTANQLAAGLPTRNNAKTFIYAFLYGAGDPKIGSIVGAGRKAGKALREKFLKTLPALGNLVDLVKKAAGKGYIKGLDGRRLKVRSDHAALNVLLQSAGAIVMKKALVIADELILSKGYVPGEDYEFIGNIHDEMQLECAPEDADIIGDCLVEGIRLAGVHFNFNCPLDGEYKVGATWAETH